MTLHDEEKPKNLTDVLNNSNLSSNRTKKKKKSKPPLKNIPNGATNGTGSAKQKTPSWNGQEAQQILMISMST